MDITQFIQKYGEPAFKDLLNISYIHNFNLTPAGWRMYCIRHGIVKHTTTIVKAYTASRSENNKWAMVQGRVQIVGKEWSTTVKLRNGAKREIFYLHFTDKQLEEWKQRETNPNQG